MVIDGRNIMQKIEIRVKGQVDQHWSEWFEGLKITHTRAGESVISGSTRSTLIIRSPPTNEFWIWVKKLAIVLIGPETSPKYNVKLKMVPRPTMSLK